MATVKDMRNQLAGTIDKWAARKNGGALIAIAIEHLIRAINKEGQGVPSDEVPATSIPPEKEVK